MSMFKTCTNCGANLDHGETCTCGRDNVMPKDWEPLPLAPDIVKPPVITSMEQLMELAREDWSNNSALGYAIRAMKNSELAEDTIQEVVNEMRWAFEAIEVKDAAKIYEQSNY